MAKEKNFQKLLEKAIKNCDPKVNPKEILEDTFKTYVARMLEQNIKHNKERLEMKFILMLKGFVISEFRKADLAEHQLTEGQYSALFDKTMKEILDFAADQHKGEDRAELDQKRILDVNSNYQMYRKTKGGIILPN